jgi:hypothetical protein
MSTYSAELDQNADSNLNALAAELGAMQVIAKALSDIRDREARQRILTWANERFTALPAPAPVPIHAVAPRSALCDDPTLSVEGLEEFFEQPRGVAEMLALQSIQELPDPAQLVPAGARGRDGGPFAKLARTVAGSIKALAAEWQAA